MARSKIPKKVETEVLTLSKRRCSLCVGVDGNYSPQLGQIAHLDQDNSNNTFDNLAWMCLDHHTVYDSKTSQNKNFTLEEVKYYRNKLYKFLEDHPLIDTPKAIRKDLNKPYCLLFDGVTSNFYIESEDFKSLSEFSVDIHFKLFEELFGGIFFSVDSSTDNSFFDLRYFSMEHKTYPGELHFRYSNPENKENICLVSMFIDMNQWNRLRIVFEKEKISLAINDQKVSTFFQKRGFTFNKVQVGGRWWKGMPQYTSFLSIYLSLFRIFDVANDKIVRELIFDYGEAYFDSLPKTKGLMMTNAPQYIRLEK